MRARFRLATLILVAMFVAGGLVACKKKVVADPAGIAGIAGEAAKAGSSLAYEHSVDIELEADSVTDRAADVRAACREQRGGACSLLSIDERAGERPRVRLVLRLAPDAVEPMVVLAAEGGRTGSRTLKAEDLADAVIDTNRQRETLLAQRERLREFGARKDLSASDLIALATRAAETKVGLQEVERAAADQQRRIETNLLTLDLSARWEPQGRVARVVSAFGDFADSFVDGVAEVLDWLAFGIPFLLVAFPLALGWRWAWRRVVRGRRS